MFGNKKDGVPEYIHKLAEDRRDPPLGHCTPFLLSFLSVYPLTNILLTFFILNTILHPLPL